MKKANRFNALGAILIMCGTLTSTAAATSADLPDARLLIDRHVETIGGKEALRAQSESTMLGEFSMPAAGMTGQLTIASRSTGERVTLIDLPGLGEMRSGYSKDLAWSIDPFMGPRLIEGEELAAQVERSEFGAVIRDNEFLTAANTVERTEFAGEACYRVKLTWRSGRTSHDCYAVDSGLLIAMESVETSPMGEVESLTLLGEYAEMHGLLVPRVTRIRVMGQEQILTVTEVSLGAPDDALFELPPPIRTLLQDR